MGELLRRPGGEAEVGVAGEEGDGGLEGVGGQAVAAVVGHVRHEHGHGVGDQGEEQLAPLDRGLQLPRPAGVV